MVRYGLLCLAVCLSFSLDAQINYPRISPLSIVKQQIGLSEIEVAYSRPSRRGRQIMGNVVPYGRIWRVGANESTKFRTSDDLTINGFDLPKGEYALYAFPEREAWTIVFHKNTEHWGDGRNAYDEQEDALRFKVKPDTMSCMQESFLISFDELQHDRAVMVWSWEKTRIVFPIQVDTHAKVMAEIRLQLSQNPTGQTYYQSARYLQEEGLSPKQAKAWLQQAQQLLGDTYYVHRVWSLIEAQMEAWEAAIEHAEQSKKLAAAEGKDEFVRMNESNIQKWHERLKKRE